MKGYEQQPQFLTQPSPLGRVGHGLICGRTGSDLASDCAHLCRRGIAAARGDELAQQRIGGDHIRRVVRAQAMWCDKIAIDAGEVVLPEFGSRSSCHGRIGSRDP